MHCFFLILIFSKWFHKENTLAANDGTKKDLKIKIYCDFKTDKLKMDSLKNGRLNSTNFNNVKNFKKTYKTLITNESHIFETISPHQFKRIKRQVSSSYAPVASIF